MSGQAIQALSLDEVLDAESVQSLMADFYNLTRIPMAIIDVAGRVLVGAGWQEVCVDFHRAHSETCANCIASDVELTCGVPVGEFRMYKCKNGMWDVSTPLMLGGKHVANVFSGQFFFDDEPLDYAAFRAQARRHGFDEDRYIAALEMAPRLSRAAVKTGMSYLTKLAGFISELSYKNIELAGALADRERLMRSLRESEDLLKRAQSLGRLGSWKLDLPSGQLSWSDEVYRIFGLHPQEFEATYGAFLSFVHPEDRQAVDQAYSGSIRDGKDSYEITHRILKRGDGEVRWLHEKCEHIRDESGRIVRSIGMVQDITERRRAEEESLHQQKLESVGLLAAGVAHDFNNLLVGVVGNASLAQDALGDENPVSELLDGVIQSGQRAADLTRQMLAYAGKGQFVIEPLDLSSFAEEISALVRRSMSKKISLELDLQKDLPPIQADRGQIQQVLMNLLINAAEAIGADVGVIRVTTRSLDADAERIRAMFGVQAPSGEYVRLDVSDDGPGMDADVQSKVFEPFFTTKFAGRGLGLAAVGGIVRTHRGVICLTSEPGKGSRFTILFPATPGRIPVTDPAVGRELLRGTETILVVDDEEAVRAFACTALKTYGYSVLDAADGAAAIETCRSAPRIDAVLLDLNMPVMGGEDTAPRLRDLKPDLKIVVSSGYGEVEALEGMPGVSGFIQKPYLPREVAAIFRKALDGDRAGNAFPRDRRADC